MNETVIYEIHVKGFTKRHTDVREDLQGTYAGLASEPALDIPRQSSASPRWRSSPSTTSPTRSSSTPGG